LREFIRNNRLVLAIYLLLVLVAIVVIFYFEKNQVHLFVNQYVGNRFVNALFFNATYLGDGVVAPFLVLAVTVINMRAGFTTTCALLLASLISTILKYQFFDDAHRPYYIFQYFDRHDLNLVEGVEMHIHNSFPSGHATQTFAILMSAVFVAKRQGFKIFFLAVAVVAAFSRVYLSQHWLVDILAGSLIGLFCSFAFYALFILRDRMRRLNKPLTALFQKKK
jgi:membrane-associated phospholipid phosphatase